MEINVEQASAESISVIKYVQVKTRMKANFLGVIIVSSVIILSELCALLQCTHCSFVLTQEVHQYCKFEKLLILQLDIRQCNMMPKDELH